MRIIPRLVPYILDHYKEQMAGLVVGTTLSQVKKRLEKDNQLLKVLSGHANIGA
jgi:hypothetical protein